MDDRIIKRLSEVTDSQICLNESMEKHTTFRIGGTADCFMTPTTPEAVRRVRLLCKEERIPLTIVGNGSNLLVSDNGIRGVVLSLMNLNDITVYRPGKETHGEQESSYEAEITCGAGVLLSTLVSRTAKEGLTGLEFAGGIPGSVGGGVVMNAGAYGGELKDCLNRVELLTPEGEIRTVPAGELELGYRTSRLQHSGEIVLSASFRLKKGDSEQIRAAIQDYNARRREKQPLEYPSAGSTFKRPEGYFAGKLIQDAGLAGYCIGDAQVSEKHCGFVINRGHATASQVKQLIEKIQQQVYEQFGVELEPEVRFLP